MIPEENCAQEYAIGDRNKVHIQACHTDKTVTIITLRIPTYFICRALVSQTI